MWPTSTRGFIKGKASEFVKILPEDDTVVAEKAMVDGMDFEKLRIYCTRPDAGTPGKQNETWQYFDLSNTIPQIVCDKVAVQGLDESGIARTKGTGSPTRPTSASCTRITSR